MGLGVGCAATAAGSLLGILHGLLQEAAGRAAVGKCQPASMC